MPSHDVCPRLQLYKTISEFLFPEISQDVTIIIDIMTHRQGQSAALGSLHARTRLTVCRYSCLVWVFTLQTYTGERASIEHVRCFSLRR